MKEVLFIQVTSPEDVETIELSILRSAMLRVIVCYCIGLITSRLCKKKK